MTGTLLLAPSAVVVIARHAAVGAIITPSPDAASVVDGIAVDDNADGAQVARSRSRPPPPPPTTAR